MSCDDRALIGGPPPRVPLHRWTGVAAQTAASATIHFVVLLVAVMLAGRASHSPRQPHDPPRLDTPVAITRLVFIARGPRPSGGGGGGGNRQTKPIRRAEGNGRDTITLRIAKPSPVAERTDAIDAAPIPGDYWTRVRWPRAHATSLDCRKEPSTSARRSDREAEVAVALALALVSDRETGPASARDPVEGRAEASTGPAATSRRRES